jgi:hypothetical protein
MQPGQHRYYRLDLRPDEVTNGAIKFTRKAIHHWAPDRLFAQDDLYTTRWGNISNTEIEQFFFGRLDNEAPSAVEFFCSFDHRRLDEKSFKRLMNYTPLKLPTQQAPRVRISLGVLPVQRLQACVNALTCWKPSSHAIVDTWSFRSWR